MTSLSHTRIFLPAILAAAATFAAIATRHRPKL